MEGNIIVLKIIGVGRKNCEGAGSEKLTCVCLAGLHSPGKTLIIIK